MLTAVAATASDTATSNRSTSVPPTVCWRAYVRGSRESKPRESIAAAILLARRIAPTSSVKTRPKSSLTAITGFPPEDTPRARRASPIVCHSVASNGSSRSAASDPYANRAGARSCWNERVGQVGGVGGGQHEHAGKRDREHPHRERAADCPSAWAAEKRVREANRERPEQDARGAAGQCGRSEASQRQRDQAADEQQSRGDRVAGGQRGGRDDQAGGQFGDRVAAVQKSRCGTGESRHSAGSR
nr:hypothetical protein [Fodinicola feengrottensis]